jgi:hypothetical protein
MLHRRKFFSTLIFFSIFYSQSTEAGLLDRISQFFKYICSTRIVRFLVIKRYSLKNTLFTSYFEKLPQMKGINEYKDKRIQKLFQHASTDDHLKEEETPQLKAWKKCYLDYAFTSLPTTVDILQDFIKSQNSQLQRGQWTRDRDLTIQNLTNIHNMHFFVQSVVFKPEDQIIFLGDLHGGIKSLLKRLELLRDKGHFDPVTGKLTVNFICLGDYVDKGPGGIQVILFLLLLKIKNPDGVFLIRGNHEDLNLFEDSNEPSLFNTELRTKLYSHGKMHHVFDENYLRSLLNQAYSLMPVALFGFYKNENQYHGFIGCHGFLDWTYHPSDLFAKMVEDHNHTIFYDPYKPKNKNVHPKNSTVKQILLNYGNITIPTIAQEETNVEWDKVPNNRKLSIKAGYLTDDEWNKLSDKEKELLQECIFKSTVKPQIENNTRSAFEEFKAESITKPRDVGFLWHYQLLGDNSSFKLQKTKGTFGLEIGKAVSDALFNDWNLILPKNVHCICLLRAHQHDGSNGYRTRPQTMNCLFKCHGCGDPTTLVQEDFNPLEWHEITQNSCLTLQVGSDTVYGVPRHVTKGKNFKKGDYPGFNYDTMTKIKFDAHSNQILRKQTRVITSAPRENVYAIVDDKRVNTYLTN